MRLRSKVLIALIALLIVGCGGGRDSFVLPDGDPSLPPDAARNVVVGRLNLGLEVPEAAFRLESLDGAVLTRGTTNANGLVFFRGLEVPESFRAVATLPGSDEEFTAVIRGFRNNNKHARISLLTTLVDRLHREGAAGSYAEAESRVKRLLGMPAVMDLSIGPEGNNPFYSDVALWRAAGRSGGWSAFSDQLVQQAGELQQIIQPGEGRRYLLSRDQLDRPIVGLEGDLIGEAERVRQVIASRLGVAPAAGEDLELFYPPTITLIAGPTSLPGQFLLGCGTGLGGNLLTDAVGGVVGWMANQMGLNYGTAGQLQEIESELSSLISLIENFVAEQISQDLTNDFNTIAGFFTTASSTSTSLRDQAQRIAITDQPVAYPSDDPLTALLNDLASQSYTSALTNANTNLLGSTEFLMSYQQAVVNEQLGLDRPANMQNLPWRSNHILDTLSGMYDHFGNLQVETLNLLAEQAHTYPVNPADAVPSLLNESFRDTLSNLKRQRQQYPLYASQWGVIVDLENGIMWWETMANADTYDNALDAAAGFSTQLVFPDGTARTYDDWRLPAYEECVALQLRGTYNPSPGDPTFTGDDTDDTVGGVPVNSKDSYPDTGQSTAGLPRLGFYQVRQALDSSMNDNGFNGDMWFRETDGAGNPLDDYEFRLNHASNNINNELSSSDKNVYLYCRTFGPNMLNWDLNTSQYPVTSYYQGSNFVSGEIVQWGVPTSISITGVEPGPASLTFPANSTQSPSSTNTLAYPANSVEIQAEVVYTLHVGGDFTVGFGSTKSESKASSSYTATVSTATVNANGPNYLAQLVDWSCDDPNALYVLNLPFTGGVAVPRAVGTVSLTATLLGGGGAVVSDTFSYDVGAVSPKTLTSIQISPRNQIYGGTGSVPSSGPDASQQYYCTGFYSDWSLEDLSTQVTWTVSDNPANAQIVVDGGGASLEMNQPPEANPPAGGYPATITATIGSPAITDSVTIAIVPEVQ